MKKLIDDSTGIYNILEAVFGALDLPLEPFYHARCISSGGCYTYKIHVDLNNGDVCKIEGYDVPITSDFAIRKEVVDHIIQIFPQVVNIWMDMRFVRNKGIRIKVKPSAS